MLSHKILEGHTRVCILGGGISGMSASYHIGHHLCKILEKNSRVGGLVQCEAKNDFIWDRGPHVSFTKSEYVKKLFADSVEDKYDEFNVKIQNYYQGNWIPHPAQLNFHAIPSPLKEQCLSSFIESQKKKKNNLQNYEEWLVNSFGTEFTNHFPRKYTKKYWTIEANKLDIDWIGVRVVPPNIEDIMSGFNGPNEIATHYIQTVRYPKNGGYYSFVKKILKDSNRFSQQLISQINLKKKQIYMSNGVILSYDKLISTIPLPDLVRLVDAPNKIQVAASELAHTSVLLVNICTTRILKKDMNWFYVYDENFYSTRVSILQENQKISRKKNTRAIQVEVYFSKFKIPEKSMDEISRIVISELMQMGVIDSIQNSFWRFIPYANVIFDKSRKASQNIIFKWFEDYGLTREIDDLHPMTSWDVKPEQELGDLIFSGRFAQWKYYWTDDCVLRGKYIADSLRCDKG